MTRTRNDKDREKSEPTSTLAEAVCLDVLPGICGFACGIQAHKMDSRKVRVKISESDCDQIRRLSKQLGDLSLTDVCAPMTSNPVFVLAEKSGCHASCVVPTAVLKAAEATMEMALPKDVSIRFQPCGKDSRQ